jgi:hypothetical protein
MMPRLTTITLDADHADDPPAQWNAAWVQMRLVHAYSTERRLPHLRQRAVSNAWPSMVIEFSDIVGRATEAREQVLHSWEYAGSGVTAADIGRMEQAHDWLRIILAPYPEERLCLSQWATAIAYGRSLRRLLLKRRWSRSTFYRYVTAGGWIIARELQRQGRPVV